ncbi:MAG TPA: phosphopantetheine-binding protein [Thermoanaerobaculia bacterium]
MTRDEIERRLIDIVRKEKNIDEAQLKPEMLLEEAGIDSLDSLTILFAIEEEFGISVPDDRARALKTVGDMMDVVADGLRIED